MDTGGPDGEDDQGSAEEETVAAVDEEKLENLKRARAALGLVGDSSTAATVKGQIDKLEQALKPKPKVEQSSRRVRNQVAAYATACDA
eukprot:15451366-Alexandrium_andersonii.AAC.1